MTAATATVSGGFWPTNGVSSLASISGTNAQRKSAAFALSRKQLLGLREIMETLDGAASGSAASKTLGRIENNVELGGVRVIETETLISRNTAAGDITDINATILAFSTKTTFGSSPVANGDGNPLGTR